MEENEKMDLTLNADFDSSLLNWQEDVAEMSAATAGTRKAAKPNTETTARPGFMRLPSFQVEGVQPKSTSIPTTAAACEGTAPAPVAVQALAANTAAPTAPIPDPTTAAAWANNHFTLPPHLYQQLVSKTQQSPAVLTQLQQASSGPSPAVLPQHLTAQAYAPVVAQANTVLPQDYAYLGAVAAPAAKTAAVSATAQPSDAATAQQPQLTQYQAALQSHQQQQQASSSFAPQQATNHQQLHPLAMPSSAPYQANGGQPMMFNPLLHVTQTVAASNSFMSMLQQQMGATPAAAAQPAPLAPPPPQVQTTNKKVKSPSNKSNTEAAAAPPFLLFDAPCELRTNFIQSQRMHGIPITQDNNSYHYGMAVNGFHPQVNALSNPILPLSSNSLPPSNVQLVDGRHHGSKRGSAKERNEREQKRAQKITELIEKLRVSIEKGGWRVELKSKYHTLTTCADYVKHLIKTTQEKEAAVEQAKLDLTVKECKLAEDKALQEARSDPESVVSSLTDGSAPAAAKVSASSGSDEDKNQDNCSCNKKRRIDGESPDSSSGEEGPGGQNISLDKMSSSVSEMTDSNKGSSAGGSDDKKAADASISSTVPVVRGEGIVDPPHGHADVVVKGKKKRKRQERNSLEPNFHLDYKEVFLTSNVPQFIATPTGKIVVCNEFFLKATGLTKEEAEGMTIFSIVEADNLSNLFEMIGRALKRDSSERDGAKETTEDSSSTRTPSTDTESKASSSSTASSRVGDYAALTLPCISFPANRHPKPLYMTVTLMTDEDPRKRCFHCVMTDCPGTNGALGSITQELLALLFAEPAS